MIRAEIARRATEQAARALAPGFAFNPGQQRALAILQGPQTHTCAYGGARGGKTFLFVQQIIQRALDAPGSRHAIMRLDGNAAWQSVRLDTFEAVMSRAYPGVVWREDTSNGYVYLPNDGNSEIWFGGLGRSGLAAGGLSGKAAVEKMLGREYATLYFVECSQIPYSLVGLMQTRLAQKVALRSDPAKYLRPLAYYDLNPVGSQHWTNRLFVQHIDPDTRRPLPNPQEYRAIDDISPEENRANLPAGYVEALAAMPERLKKRFYKGVYQADIDGALWTIEMLDRQRIERAALPQLVRVVIGVDPSGTSGAEDSRSNEVGIAAVGLGADDQGYLLEDGSGNMAPEAWAKRVRHLYDKWEADAVVAEKNFGGDMVRTTLHSHDALTNASGAAHVIPMPIRLVTASRGKAVRAEPISIMYGDSESAGRVWHVGPREKFALLEDQLLNFSGAGYQGSKSPDRADALVWGLTELMVRGERIPLAGAIVVKRSAAAPIPVHMGGKGY